MFENDISEERKILKKKKILFELSEVLLIKFEFLRFELRVYLEPSMFAAVRCMARSSSLFEYFSTEYKIRDRFLYFESLRDRAAIDEYDSCLG